MIVVIQCAARKRKKAGNPLSLLSASELYAKAAYRELAAKFGADNTYILAAGWESTLAKARESRDWRLPSASRPKEHLREFSERSR